MKRGRLVLLTGCALGLGTLAATDMAARERALRSEVGGLVPVVVAARELAPGHRIVGQDLRVRQVPERWAPRERYPEPRALVGVSTATTIAKGSDLARSLLQGGAGEAPVGRGERITSLTGRGSAKLIAPGTRVDVLVTRDSERGGVAELVLRNAEVLSSRAVASEDDKGDVGRVAVSLRTKASQVDDLALAEDYAREIRILPRGPDDDSTSG